MSRIAETKWVLVLFAITILTAGLAIPVGANDPDHNHKLYGEYALYLTANCASCGAEFNTTILGGFGANLPVCPAGATSTSYSWNTQGVLTFNGQGTVNFSGRYLAVLQDPMPVYFPPASQNFIGEIPVVLSSELQCLEGDYRVTDDLAVAVGFEKCTVTVANGVKVHEIFNLNLKGRLFDRMDGSLLLLNDTLDPGAPLLPNVENVKNLFPPSPDTYRICGYSGTAMKMRGPRVRSK